jgi:OTU domain-containing protein 3
MIHSSRRDISIDDSKPISQLILLGTYGGHLELSAFAHLKRKNVKVIQPGLVYVIEWDAGSPFPDSPRDEDKDIAPLSPDGDRDKRRSRREKRRTSADANMSTEPSGSHALGDTVYIA